MIAASEIQALVAAVRDVAKAEILPRFRNLDAAEITSKSAPDDLVTIADQQAEIALTARMRALWPDCAVVGEEAVADDPTLTNRIGTAERCVILDPIDGTSNFVEGLALFGVILAVVDRGQTVFGLLYDPVVDDWVAAARGQGVWMGRPGKADRALSARKVGAADAVGFLGVRLYPPEARGRLFDAYAEFNRVRSIFCSAHEYRQIALGHADFLVSPGANPWDHAAGALIIEELGGAVLANGAPYQPAKMAPPILASANPDLVADIQTAMERAPEGPVP